jgi:CubicO group peptidase (beta-lactamase class C family)
MNSLIATTRDELRKRMLGAVALGRTPGVSIAYVSPGEPAIVETAGNAQLSPMRAVEPATIYPWFSVTKLFTATAVLQLAQTGKVGLDASISDYLPTVRMNAARPPTVRQLLSLTSGLANPIPIGWIHLVSEQGPALDEMSGRLFREHPNLSFTPGARFSYSNLNYLLLTS